MLDYKFLRKRFSKNCFHCFELLTLRACQKDQLVGTSKNVYTLLKKDLNQFPYRYFQLALDSCGIRK